MEWENNGKTQEAGGRRQTSVTSDRSKRLGGFEEPSGVDGTQQIGHDYNDCSRENIVGQTQQREEPSGKILERLEFIENAHLSYIKGDQQRLESRLKESKEQEEIFRKGVQELKEELYKLLSSQETNNTEE